MAVTHSKVSAIADVADTTIVRPSDWNADHLGTNEHAHSAAASGGVLPFATPAIVLGTAAAAGAATTPIRSDATLLVFDATAPTTQAFGDAAAVGTATVAARRDHKHAMPADPRPLDLWIGPIDPRLLDSVGAGAFAANWAQFHAFQVSRSVSVTQCKLQITTQSGNLDVAIYEESGALTANRLGSSGATAAGAAGIQTVALTGSVALVPGIKYWAAIATSDGTIRINCKTNAGTTGSVIQGDPAVNMALGTTYPLPTSVTFTASSVTHFVIGMYFS